MKAARWQWLGSVIVLTLVPSTAPASVQTKPAASEPAVSRPANDISTILECEEPVYDVGTVWGRTVIKHEFVVRNVSSRTLCVKSVEARIGTGGSHVYRVAPSESFAIPVTLTVDGNYVFYKQVSLYIIDESE